MMHSSALLQLRQSTSWAVQAEGIFLQHLVFDLVEQADRSVLGVVRSEPEQIVTLRFPWIGTSTCTCGGVAPHRVCAHIVAVWLRWHRSTGALAGSELSVFAGRVDAMSALTEATAAVARSYGTQADAEGDDLTAWGDLAVDMSRAGIIESVAVARALVDIGRPTLAARLALRMIDQVDVAGLRPSYPEEAQVIGLIRLLSGPELTRPGGAGPEVLMHIMDRVLEVPDSPGNMSPGWLLADVVIALDRLVMTRAVDPLTLARRIVAACRDAHPSRYPTIVAISSRLMYSSREVLALAYAELGSTPMQDVPAEDGVIVRDAQREHRLRAECARGADDPRALVNELESWPCAQFGEYFVRTSSHGFLNGRAIIAAAAERNGRLRWEPAWPDHLPSVVPRVLLRPNWRHDRLLVEVIHRTHIGHPIWSDIAIGDAVMSFVAIDRIADAQRMLVGFARGNSKPRHQREFERIWNAAGFPGSSAEAAREIFLR